MFRRGGAAFERGGCSQRWVLGQAGWPGGLHGERTVIAGRSGLARAIKASTRHHRPPPHSSHNHRRQRPSFAPSLCYFRCSTLPKRKSLCKSYLLLLMRQSVPNPSYLLQGPHASSGQLKLSTLLASPHAVQTLIILTGSHVLLPVQYHSRLVEVAIFDHGRLGLSGYSIALIQSGQHVCQALRKSGQDGSCRVFDWSDDCQRATLYQLRCLILPVLRQGWP